MLALAGCEPPAPRTQPIVVGDRDAPPIVMTAEPRAPVATAKGPSAEIGSDIGQEAPLLDAAGVVGDGPDDVDEARGRVTILHFWATFCAPCRVSLGEFQSLANRHGKGVAVIAVSVDDPQDVMVTDIRDFALGTGARYAIVWDNDRDAADRYQVPRLPTTYVLDRNGIVRHIHPGHTSEDAASIGEEVKRLLR